MKFNIKVIARTIEHIILISFVAGCAGFYLGNQFGTRHVDVSRLKTAPTTSQSNPVVESTSK